MSDVLDRPIAERRCETQAGIVLDADRILGVHDQIGRNLSNMPTLNGRPSIGCLGPEVLGVKKPGKATVAAIRHPDQRLSIILGAVAGETIGRPLAHTSDQGDFGEPLGPSPESQYWGFRVVADMNAISYEIDALPVGENEWIPLGGIYKHGKRSVPNAQTLAKACLKGLKDKPDELTQDWLSGADPGLAAVLRNEHQILRPVEALV